jgi:hypothetical protein
MNINDKTDIKIPVMITDLLLMLSPSDNLIGTNNVTPRKWRDTRLSNH